MININRFGGSKAGGFGRPFLAILFMLAFTALAFGQSSEKEMAGTTSEINNKPDPYKTVATIYKDVKIGTTADDVRHLLGKAKIDDKDGFFFDGDNEMIQIRLDKKENVKLISVTYSGDISRAPKFVDIFPNETIDARPDGSVYKLVRYPDEGFWIAYSRTARDKPTVTVTMKKL